MADAMLSGAPSPLDTLFPASGYDQLLDPQEIAGARRNALLRAGLSLLAGSRGPQGTLNAGETMLKAFDPTEFRNQLQSMAQLRPLMMQAQAMRMLQGQDGEGPPGATPQGAPGIATPTGAPMSGGPGAPPAGLGGGAHPDPAMDLMLRAAPLLNSGNPVAMQYGAEMLKAAQAMHEVAKPEVIEGTGVDPATGRTVPGHRLYHGDTQTGFVPQSGLLKAPQQWDMWTKEAEPWTRAGTAAAQFLPLVGKYDRSSIMARAQLLDEIFNPLKPRGDVTIYQNPSMWAMLGEWGEKMGRAFSEGKIDPRDMEVLDNAAKDAIERDRQMADIAVSHHRMLSAYGELPESTFQNPVTEMISGRAGGTADGPLSGAERVERTLQKKRFHAKR